MLFAKPTPKGAGLIVYGDYYDLRSVYSTITDLFPETDNESPFAEFMLGLAYEIRHAYQGDREIYKDLPVLQTYIGKYFGFRVIWVYCLAYLTLLRDSAGYVPTSAKHQAILYSLESCVFEALVDYDAGIGQDCMERLRRLGRLPPNYVIQFLDERAREFVCEGKAGKTRFRKLPEFIRSLNSYSNEYRAYRDHLERVAKEKGCSIKSLYNPTPFCDFKW